MVPQNGIEMENKMEEKSFFSMESGFTRFMNFLWSLIEISILQLVCSLPVITAGAAAAAGYYAVAKSLRFYTGTPGKEFFRGFRKNFRQGLLLSLIFGTILGVLILDCTYFYGNQRENSLALLYLFYGLTVLTLVIMEYAVACLSRFQMKTGALLRMAFVLPVKHLITTVLLLILTAALAFCLFMMPWGLLVFPGLAVYLSTFLLEPVLRKYTPEPEPGHEKKWYQE